MWQKKEELINFSLRYTPIGGTHEGLLLGVDNPTGSAVRQLLLTVPQKKNSILKLIKRRIADYPCVALLARQKEVDGTILGLAIEEVLVQADSSLDRLHPAEALQAVITVAKRAQQENWKGLLAQCVEAWRTINKEKDHASLEQDIEIGGCMLGLLSQEDLPGIIEELMERDPGQRHWSWETVTERYQEWGLKSLAPLLGSRNKNVRIAAANIASKIAPKDTKISR